MANNRMWLHHKASKKRFLLAKYYPSTGWYQFQSREQLDAWFNEFSDGSQWGDQRFELVLDCVDVLSE